MNQPGTELEYLSWKEAESLLMPDTIVVIPVGAQLKEHGLHLPLNNDWLLAEYLKKEVLKRFPVVVTPTLGHNFYPAMVDYPGTVSLREKTAENLMVDIIASLNKFGPRRFYVLNTGISTIRVLEKVKDYFAEREVAVAFTDLRVLLESLKEEVEEQEGGTHADEIETSMMLSIAPHIVNMELARKDYQPGKGPLRRTREDKGVYSPTGAWGDPTKASIEKGDRLMHALVEGIAADIQNIFNR